MKKILKRIWSFIWNNYRRFTFFLSLILIGLSIHIIYKNAQFQKQRETHIYQEVFDLRKLPTGLVIWKHGVPGTEMNFAHADSSFRYKYFDVGILTKDKIIYKVRLPFYLTGLIMNGFPVDFKDKPKITPHKRNPNSNSYVYPYNKEKKLKNL